MKSTARDAAGKSVGVRGKSHGLDKKAKQRKKRKPKSVRATVREQSKRSDVEAACQFGVGGRSPDFANSARDTASFRDPRWKTPVNQR
ncbi:hypothetical protein [Aeoliella mucimassa]|uniref:Uncharacterized protein n=1 Tax=Aeoliella mucimassa TaxID=2527972 RepID=A0A518AM35_9BACT|nr:hypothetical protein [Aeoliella mucimassa]QDU55779.1 hypothetical protein Pan181_19750 [Aeoliella mucimassa]